MRDALEATPADAGLRVFDCMIGEAAELLAEAQAEWLSAPAEKPEIALEGLRAAAALAAVGVWLARLRDGAGPQAPLAIVWTPPPPQSGEEDGPGRRLRALSARAGRLYERAARLDGLLRGVDPEAPSERAPVFRVEEEASSAPDARGRQAWLSRAISSGGWC